MAIETFDFADATHEDIGLLIGLSGASGGGKSKSAMLLAYGIQQYLHATHGDAGPIVFIDTDNGRGRMLAPRPGQAPEPPRTFAFQYLRLGPPFAPARFDAAVAAAKLLGPSVIVIDNVSDEWAGEGGILEYVDEQQARPGNKFAAWNKPKTAHRMFIATLKQAACPVIMTAMAEDKMKLVGDKPTSIGWTPVLCKTPPLARDLTFHFLVGAKGQPGELTASRSEFDHAKTGMNAEGLIKDGEVASEETGRRLAMWADGKWEGAMPQNEE